MGLSLVPRPVRAIRVTRGGLESRTKSPRTTGNETGWDLLSGFHKQKFSGLRILARKKFPDSGIPLQRVTWIIQFKYGGFRRLKSVKGTYNVVTERRTKKTEEKKTTDGQPGQQRKKKLKSHVYFRSINVRFPSMLDKKIMSKFSVVKRTSSVTEVI